MSSLESAAGNSLTTGMLHEIQVLIEEPLEPKRVGLAYDLVRDSSKKLKQVVRALRDLLAISCCLGKGRLTPARFED